MQIFGILEKLNIYSASRALSPAAVGQKRAVRPFEDKCLFQDRFLKAFENFVDVVIAAAALTVNSHRFIFGYKRTVEMSSVDELRLAGSVPSGNHIDILFSDNSAYEFSAVCGIFELN